MELTAQAIMERSKALMTNWAGRNTQFRDWYEYITFVDKLKQPQMESFVSNEPRTFFNLGMHMLMPESISPRIPLNEIEAEDMADAAIIEKYLSIKLNALEHLALKRGRGGWMRELTSFLLLTGWYSVFSVPTNTGAACEIWNPAEVFPEFGDDGIVSCAHVYTLPGKSMAQRVRANRWVATQSLDNQMSVTAYDYYTQENGIIEHGIVVGNEVVVPFAQELSLKRFPIYCAPIGGLPDRGVISSIQGSGTYTDTLDWHKHVGESIIEPNRLIYDYTNKVFTFMMQLIRDTAQTRWLEKSTGAEKIKPDDIYKRGAKFTLGVNEDFAPVAMPPIPIELRALQFDIQAMRQKGSLPDVLYANVQQQISGYLMTQVSGMAAHILRPYAEGLKFLLVDLVNDWLEDAIAAGMLFEGKPLPAKNFPRVDIDLRINIPGDVVQRATVARMLDPRFSLSTETVTDLLFPEIRNPLQEMAKVLNNVAMQNPILANLHLMEALKARAAMLNEAGQPDMAAVYSKVADNLIQPMMSQPETMPGAGGISESEIARQFPMELPPQQRMV